MATTGVCNNGTCDHARSRFHHGTLDGVLEANREWAASVLAADPGFFQRLTHQQAPEFLWIGCADSRVPANQILNMSPGEVFVQRNVGNQAMHTDMNCMSCLEYSIKSLKVKTIIVCGHYNCGAVRAALELPSRTPGLVNCWISDIREARSQASRELAGLSREEALRRLCELNVMRQVFHVCTSPVVQEAWAVGQEVHVWGVIYDVADGLVHRLAGPMNASSDIDSLRYEMTAVIGDDAKSKKRPREEGHPVQEHAVAPVDAA